MSILIAYFCDELLSGTAAMYWVVVVATTTKSQFFLVSGIHLLCTSSFMTHNNSTGLLLFDKALYNHRV